MRINIPRTLAYAGAGLLFVGLLVPLGYFPPSVYAYTAIPGVIILMIRPFFLTPNNK